MSKREAWTTHLAFLSGDADYWGQNGREPQFPRCILNHIQARSLPVVAVVAPSIPPTRRARRDTSERKHRCQPAKLPHSELYGFPATNRTTRWCTESSSGPASVSTDPPTVCSRGRTARAPSQRRRLTRLGGTSTDRELCRPRGSGLATRTADAADHPQEHAMGVPCLRSVRSEFRLLDAGRR